MTGGVWYPQGGIYQIGAALARLAAELGVVIETGGMWPRLCGKTAVAPPSA
jgi:hypothetical protein